MIDFLRLLLLALLLAPASFAAHAFNQSYIYLRVYDTKVEGRVEINLSDLNRAIGTKFRTDLTATPEDVTAEIDKIKAYLFGRVAFSVGGKTIELEHTGHGMYESAGSQYVSCRFDLQGVDNTPDSIDITHKLMFDIDPEHRGFVVIEHFFRKGVLMNEGVVSLTYSPNNTTQTLDLTDASVWQGFLSLTKLGVHHILIGIDHVLFLLVLLLPSVLRRRERHWEPRVSFKSSLWDVVKIVTVFTIAHSVTLSLAALDIMTLPSRLVESIIALSIAIAALDVFFPVLRKRVLLIVLGFGLFHGFGFASVLGEMGVAGTNMAWSLFGFNVGVELGQIAIVCGIFPLLFMMRLSKLYTRFFVYVGALICIFISIYWFIERAFETDLLLGEYLAPVLNFF